MAGQIWFRKLTFICYNIWFYSFFILFITTGTSRTQSNVLTVADTNWTLILEGEWMLKFYAPWCPACQQIQADWEMFAKDSESLGISVGKVDVTQQPGLSGRFLVTTLPTIFHAKDGSFRRYLSSRAIEDIKAYVVERKWEAVEPLPGWKSPSSFLMSGMAGLFQLSVWIRQIHSYLTDTLGLPVWGSYVIFALATLITGLLLGLVLVLIVDCFCPSRPTQREDKAVAYVKEDVSEDETEDTLAEEKHASDTEEYQRVSAEEEEEDEEVEVEESAEEEDSPVTELASGSADQPPPDGVRDNAVRKRKTQGPEAPEGT